MVDGTAYTIRNIADNIKDFYKGVMAPYGTNMIFVEIVKGELINTGNIVSIREMSDEEVNAINESEIEEVVGLTETEVEVEELENKPEDTQ